MPNTTLLKGDCLEVLPTIPDGSVSLVCADLPYGVTNNRWDTVIPLAPLWEHLLRVGKSNCAFVFTATQPFATALINSQAKLFRYDLVWRKSRPTGFMMVKKQPLREHEALLVFYVRQPIYNPQMEKAKHIRSLSARCSPQGPGNWGQAKFRKPWVETGVRYPKSIRPVGADNTHHSNLHPTQKPVALLEWLIKTYSNPGDLVLDPTMGSCTTGVACINTGRRFIGIEKDAGYFEICQKRVVEASRQMVLV